MSLSLPEDAEVFLNDDYPDWATPGVYALVLRKPDDVPSAWDAEFESRPDYFEQLCESEQVIYVGAAKNVMARLEDHRDGKVRKAALMRVCEIESLRNIWFYDSADMAFVKESQIAMELQNHYGGCYVHSR